MSPNMGEANTLFGLYQVATLETIYTVTLATTVITQGRLSLEVSLCPWMAFLNQPTTCSFLGIHKS
jgi:hypothetical protein